MNALWILLAICAACRAESPECDKDKVNKGITLMAHETYAQKFYSCDQSLNPVEFPCSDDLLFDTEINQCNWASKTKRTTWNTNSDCTSSDNDEPDVCCGKYWTCDEGIWSSQSCSGDQVFNKETFGCEDDVDCEDDSSCSTAISRENANCDATMVFNFDKNPPEVTDERNGEVLDQSFVIKGYSAEGRTNTESINDGGISMMYFVGNELAVPFGFMITFTVDSETTGTNFELLEFGPMKLSFSYDEDQTQWSFTFSQNDDTSNDLTPTMTSTAKTETIRVYVAVEEDTVTLEVFTSDNEATTEKDRVSDDGAVLMEEGLVIAPSFKGTLKEFELYQYCESLQTWKGTWTAYSESS